jgi:hypothetical protein
MRIQINPETAGFFAFKLWRNQADMTKRQFM